MTTPASFSLCALKHRVLKAFNGSSKNVRTFTTGTDYNLAPDVAQKHLDQLVAYGCIKPVRNDSYSITNAGLLALNLYNKKSSDRAPVRASDYVPPKPTHARAGSGDAFSLPSFGDQTALKMRTF